MIEGLKDVNDTIEQAVPGKGFWDDIPTPLAAWRNSNAQTLTSGTTPTLTISSNEQIITWAATVTNAVTISLPAPANLAKGTISSAGVRGSALRLIVRARTGGTTDTVTLTATVYARSSTGAQKGPFTATVTLTSGETNPRDYVIDLTCLTSATFGDKILPGDKLDISLAPSAHGTDAVIVSNLFLTYRRNASNTSKTDPLRP